MDKCLLITGSSGYWGQSLLRLLRDHNAFCRIVGVDIQGPGLEFDGFVHHRMDIRDPSVGHIMEDNKVDQVLHLAFALNVFRKDSKVRDININGTRNLLDQSLRCGVQRFLLASSATVYGGHADNPVVFYEQDKLLKTGNLFYTRDKVDIEEMVKGFADKHTAIDFVVIRPAIIAGPSMRNILSWSLRFLLFLPAVKGFNPPLQFIHESDLAYVTFLLLTREGSGAYNVGADDTIAYHEVVRMFGKRPLPLPGWWMRHLARMSARLRLTSPIDGGVNLISYPWIISNERVKKELGYSFRYNSRQALEAVFRGKTQ